MESNDKTMKTSIHVPDPDDDIRYHYAVCPQCGKAWQMIDFRCARHALTCAVDQIDYSVLSTSPTHTEATRQDWLTPVDEYESIQDTLHGRTL